MKTNGSELIMLQLQMSKQYMLTSLYMGSFCNEYNWFVSDTKDMLDGVRWRNI